MDAAREHYSGTQYATRRCPRAAINATSGLAGILDLYDARAGIGERVLDLPAVTVAALNAYADGRAYAEAHRE